MAKQKPGVYDRVLECAKEEFLSKGFLDASLRTIAQEAGTSTGSIYTRFGDKEGLFQAIVEPVVDQFKAMFREIQESFHQLDGETQKAEMGLNYRPVSHNEGTATYFREMLRLVMNAERPKRNQFYNEWDYEDVYKRQGLKATGVQLWTFTRLGTLRYRFARYTPS